MVEKYSPTEAEQMAVTERMIYVMKRESCRSPYVMDADADTYRSHLRGLDAFFAHMRTFPYPRVLDIGAGEATGAKQLAESLGKGIAFEATGLRPPKEAVPFPYHVTMGEDLLGVKDVSITGALARYSVAYAACPRMVVAAIDRVLVPGGVFKGTFFRSGESAVPLRSLNHPTAQEFEEAFSALDYDVQNGMNGRILLAVKPGYQGTTQGLTASELYKEDEKLWKNSS